MQRACEDSKMYEYSVVFEPMIQSICLKKKSLINLYPIFEENPFYFDGNSKIFLPKKLEDDLLVIDAGNQISYNTATIRFVKEVLFKDNSDDARFVFSEILHSLSSLIRTELIKKDASKNEILSSPRLEAPYHRANSIKFCGNQVYIGWDLKRAKYETILDIITSVLRIYEDDVALGQQKVRELLIDEIVLVAGNKEPFLINEIEFDTTVENFNFPRVSILTRGQDNLLDYQMVENDINVREPNQPILFSYNYNARAKKIVKTALIPELCVLERKHISYIFENGNYTLYLKNLYKNVPYVDKKRLFKQFFDFITSSEDAIILLRKWGFEFQGLYQFTCE